MEIKEYSVFQHNMASFAIDEVTITDGIRSLPMTRAVNPGDNISMYPENIQDICNDFWTQEVRDNHAALLAAQQEE